MSSRASTDYLGQNVLKFRPDSDAGSDTASTFPTSIGRNALPSVRLGSTVVGKRLVIAIDYGTTYTGVGIAFPPLDAQLAKLEDIDIIRNFGRGKMSNTEKVPSTVSFSKALAGEEQWGFDIGEDATVMVHTKLELDEQPYIEDELESILYNLEGMKDLSFEAVIKGGALPDYPVQSPEEIVEHYMLKVYDVVNQRLEHLDDADMRHTIPVDIVFTVPLEWSYAAQNATYKAITKAGFNKRNFNNLQEILMLTEPEAAALYAARSLKEDKDGIDLLKLNECFIICDAGGGTVDLVSYRVTQLTPILKLQKIGEGSSGKCGSVFINKVFKTWLRDQILRKVTVNFDNKETSAYEILEPNSPGRISLSGTEHKRMRKVMSKFIELKESFTGEEEHMKISLPYPLDSLTIQGRINKGDILISAANMEKIFDVSINEVVELIEGQVSQVRNDQRKQVKNILMVGGYGSSVYLQERIRAEIKGHDNINVHYPKQNSWSAVTRGAVIYGIEKTQHSNAVKTKPCPSNYGIATNEDYQTSWIKLEDLELDDVLAKRTSKQQLTWLLKRGDLILLSKPYKTQETAIFSFTVDDPRTFEIPIYEYTDEDDWLPSHVEGREGDLEHVTNLRIDLNKYDVQKFPARKHKKGEYRLAVFHITMELKDGALTLEVFWKGQSVCSYAHSDQATTSSSSSPYQSRLPIR